MKIKSGDTVKIKKGSMIWNTKLGYSEPYPAGKTYTVKVHDVTHPTRITVGVQVSKDDGSLEIQEGFFWSTDDKEKFNKWLDENDLTLLEEAMEKHPESFYIEENDSSKVKHVFWTKRSTEICWVGAGKYWHYTSIDNVEVVE